MANEMRSWWGTDSLAHQAVVAPFTSTMDEITAELEGPSKTIIVEPVEVPEPVEAPAAPEEEPIPA